MIINRDIQVRDSFKWNGVNVTSVLTDNYQHGLHLIRGFIGGGYIGSTTFRDILKLSYATDTFMRGINDLNYATWYGGGASALTNGYVFHTGGSSSAVDRVNFPTEAVTGIAGRPVGGGGSMSVMQQGVGFEVLQGSNRVNSNQTLASYGFKAYVCGKNDYNLEILTFSTESWLNNTASFTGGGYGVGWFDRYNGWQFASAYGGSNTTTYTMPFSTEVMVNAGTNGSPGSLGMCSGGAEKGVNSKKGKFYLASSNWSCFVTTVYRYATAINTWTVNYGSQTNTNNEHCGNMGQHYGYLVGGYNGAQNGITNKVNYDLDTIFSMQDAPRSTSSASPMWSAY